MISKLFYLIYLFISISSLHKFTIYKGSNCQSGNDLANYVREDIYGGMYGGYGCFSLSLFYPGIEKYITPSQYALFKADPNNPNIPYIGFGANACNWGYPMKQYTLDSNGCYNDNTTSFSITTIDKLENTFKGYMLAMTYKKPVCENATILSASVYKLFQCYTTSLYGSHYECENGKPIVVFSNDINDKCAYKERGELSCYFKCFAGSGTQYGFNLIMLFSLLIMIFSYSINI